MRYTVTSELDPVLYDELERERSSGGISRSAAIRQAIEWWIAQRKEHGEERVGRHEKRHRQLMNRLDHITGIIKNRENLLVNDKEEPAPEQGSEGHLAEARKRARRNTR